MSSFTRTIQRSSNRTKKFMGRGSQLGVNNPKDKCLLARKKRENERIS